MPYEKRKRNKIDRCNICLAQKELSWDHIPPKGGIVLSSVEIKNIFQIIAGRPDDQYRISQNGVKYRTICSACNSKLGSDFDPVLNSLNETITRYLKSHLILPKVLYLKVKPKRLIKAILGHIIAAKFNIDESVFDAEVRKYLISDTEQLPKEANIFFWIYPYDNTVIMRDFMIPANLGDFSSMTFCHLLKYFPIAFIVTGEEKFRGLPCLTKYKDFALDEECEIQINLNSVELPDWPERVDNSNILVASAETNHGIFATPRKK